MELTHYLATREAVKKEPLDKPSRLPEIRYILGCKTAIVGIADGYA